MAFRQVKDLLEWIYDFHHMYLLRAELAEMPEEAELFQQLAAHQDAEARLQSRDIARLEIY
jgi:hypothetical protein